MKVIYDLTSETITEQVKEHVSTGACPDTDASTSYADLKDSAAEHRPVKAVDKKQVGRVFPWVHIAITSAKLANHHKIREDFLQFYLNGFCCKFNRRYFGQTTFDRLLLCAVSHKG
jgi:hypothetical protein